MIDMFMYGFENSPIITTLITIFLVLLIGGCIYYAMDAWFLEDVQGDGTAVDKKFTPAHTTTILIYNAATKTSLPHFIHHSDCWEITFKVKNMIGSVQVTKEQFNKLSDGDIAKLTYSYGRISSDLYIKKCLV